MDFSSILSIAFSVVKDWRVIITFVAMVLVIILTNKIVNYKKRPKRIKSKKGKNNKTPAPAPAKEAPKEEETDEAEE